MRIGLLSPYSWTYPGGVTRHIEALSRALAEDRHDPWILAPFDPDDDRARHMHRGARPQPREAPPNLIPLGRTIGIPANGAVSNMALTPSAVMAMRGALRHGGFDVLHIHEPVVPTLAWDALLSSGELPLVGTFHTYSENVLTNGIAAVVLGGRRRMNRLHVRIAVSEAAAWTARRFYGGRYRIIPNGVQLPDGSPVGNDEPAADGEQKPFRILFIGQAVERKGLPIVLRAFEALREEVPATLRLVGAAPREVAPMILDPRGVTALGKVSEERKLQELQRADIVCAPSLGGESFGMVLTEAFAAGRAVVASDIPGYRDVLRDGEDGVLVPPGDARALGEALRQLALDRQARGTMERSARERAERFAWGNVAAEVQECYEQARSIARPVGALPRAAVRHGFAPADRLPRIPAERLPSLAAGATSGSLSPVQRRERALRRAAIGACSAAVLALAVVVLRRTGVDQLAASLVSSKPGLIAAAFGSMCAAMLARAMAWHAILDAAPLWRRPRRRDAMQGTFIGVLMSSTQPARLGERSRSLIVARRLGRARETLPIVLATMISQTIINLLALVVLGAAVFSSVDPLDGRHGPLLIAALAPLVGLAATLAFPALIPSRALPRSARIEALVEGARRWVGRAREGFALFRRRRVAARALVRQLGAWGLQLLSCWLLLMAFGLDASAGIGGAAAVLFAVNATAVLPATPANVGVFQVACASVLIGAYHVSTPDAIAFSIVLQVIELLTAVVMGVPALINEGMSLREVRLRTLHAAPVKLAPLPAGSDALAGRASLERA